MRRNTSWWCDDDVDVTNLDHLLWAMLTRTDPKESIQFIEGSWDSPADPRLSPEKRAKGDMTHSVAIIDACRPWSLARQVPADQHAEPRGRAQGAGEVRLAVGWEGIIHPQSFRGAPKARTRNPDAR